MSQVEIGLTSESQAIASSEAYVHADLELFMQIELERVNRIGLKDTDAAEQLSDWLAQTARKIERDCRYDRNRIYDLVEVTGLGAVGKEEVAKNANLLQEITDEEELARDARLLSFFISSCESPAIGWHEFKAHKQRTYEDELLSVQLRNAEVQKAADEIEEAFTIPMDVALDVDPSIPTVHRVKWSESASEIPETIETLDWKDDQLVVGSEPQQVAANMLTDLTVEQVQEIVGTHFDVIKDFVRDLLQTEQTKLDIHNLSLKELNEIVLNRDQEVIALMREYVRRAPDTRSHVWGSEVGNEQGAKLIMTMRARRQADRGLRALQKTVRLPEIADGIAERTRIEEQYKRNLIDHGAPPDPDLRRSKEMTGTFGRRSVSSKIIQKEEVA